MKNYLIITIGTRDVQIQKAAVEPNDFEIEIEIRREVPFRFVRHRHQPDTRVAAKTSDDFPDFYTLNPRADGRMILKGENWDLFRPILDVPLIRPALEYLKSQSVSIDIIMLVFTDQQQAFDEGRVKKASYIAGDTVFFADIIERFIREDSYFNQTAIDPFGRYESVADMAVQYDEFRKIKKDLISDDEVGKVYLFAQGGIDQINQALTLRLIELFEGRVVYLQNAEGHQVQELDFPRRFMNVLNEQKVHKHLADYDFGYIDKALYQDKLVCHLAQYASRRLNLQHNQVKVNTDVLLKDSRVEPLWAILNQPINTDQQKLEDLYLSVKISSHQRKYADLLWRLFTLGENLFKVSIEAVLGPVDKYRMKPVQLRATNNRNADWESCLSRIDSSLIVELSATKNYKGYPVSVDNPNRWAYQALHKILTAKGFIPHRPDQVARYTIVGNAIEELATSRNDIAHKLGSVSLNEINQVLAKYRSEYMLQTLLTDLDQIFNITGFGIYDTIRDEIRQLLDQTA